MSTFLELDDLKNIRHWNRVDKDRNLLGKRGEAVIDQLIDIMETKPEDKPIKDILYEYLRHNIRLDGYDNGEDIFIRLYFDDKLLDECQFRIQTRD